LKELSLSLENVLINGTIMDTKTTALDPRYGNPVTFGYKSNGQARVVQIEDESKYDDLLARMRGSVLSQDAVGE
jgi:hypothetical protein